MKKFLSLLFLPMTVFAQEDWPFDIEVNVDHDSLVTGQDTFFRWTVLEGLDSIESCVVEIYNNIETNKDLIRSIPKTNIYKNGSQKLFMENNDLYVLLRCKPVNDTQTLSFGSGITWKDKTNLAEESPDCFPKPIGSGYWPKRATINPNTINIGECLAWWCPKEEGITPAGFCWHWSDIAPTKTIEWVLGLNDSSATQEWKTYDKWSTLSKSEAEVLLALSNAAKPQATVKPYSTNADRPTYPITSEGTRSSSSNGRVAVGAPCDCSKIVSTSSRGYYCDVSMNLDARTGEPLPSLNEDGTGGSFSMCEMN